MKKARSVPDYMGRILSPAGVPQGSCFQIAPGYLVTAWHVLQMTMELSEDDGDEGAVFVDHLSTPGSAMIRATRVAGDKKADLALLKVEDPFPGSVRLVRSSDAVAPGEELIIVGHAVIRDGPDQPDLVWTEARGEWEGQTRRGDLILGRLRSMDVLQGMSGAPVRRRKDDSVVGVVSARYNTIDGWFSNSVWVARTAELRELCRGHVDLTKDRWVGFAAAGAAFSATEFVMKRKAEASTDAVREATLHVPANGSTPEKPSVVDKTPGGGGAPDAMDAPGPPDGLEEIVENMGTSAAKSVARFIRDYLF